MNNCAAFNLFESKAAQASCMFINKSCTHMPTQKKLFIPINHFKSIHTPAMIPANAVSRSAEKI